MMDFYTCTTLIKEFSEMCCFSPPRFALLAVVFKADLQLRGARPWQSSAASRSLGTCSHGPLTTFVPMERTVTSSNCSASESPVVSLLASCA